MSADHAAFTALCALSAQLGEEPLQVQGPGGNTSIKRGESMLIKASGTALADAERDSIFVAVDHVGLAAALRTGQRAAERAADWRRGDSALRPSIETAVHAVMRWPVVLHTHCVASIAASLRADAEHWLAQVLHGSGVVHIPYTMPGTPLAREIIARGADSAPVLVLGNHGLLVGGADVAEAGARLRAVSAALEAAAPPRDCRPREAPTRAPAGWYWTRGPGLQLAAGAFAEALRHGALYPDHVVFLGPAVALAAPGADPSAATAAAALDGARPQLVLVRGQGALLPCEAPAIAHTMARCLGAVVARLPPGCRPRTLDNAQQRALIDWEAEAWRRRQSTARAP